MRTTDSGGRRTQGQFTVGFASLPSRLSRMALRESFREWRRLSFRCSSRLFPQRLQFRHLAPQSGHFAAEALVFPAQEPQLPQQAPPSRRPAMLRSCCSHAPDYWTDSCRTELLSSAVFKGGNLVPCTFRRSWTGELIFRARMEFTPEIASVIATETASPDEDFFIIQ